MVRTVVFEVAEVSLQGEAEPRGRETAAGSSRPGAHRNSGPWF
jgi:hypothetical protein